MTVAVIDLGTNTFHLLVASLSASEIKVVLRERRFVKLGKDGIGSFSEETLARANNCLEFFKQKLSPFGDLSIRVIGTAALRSSDNAYRVAEMVKKMFNSKLEIIDGDREAELIYKGVCFAGHPNDQTNLIVDIGGGSVEFILFKKENIVYQSSVNIGIGWMFHRFKHSDPIRQEEIRELEHHLEQHLDNLQIALNTYRPEMMIGASGTFDLLFNQLSPTAATDPIQKERLLIILNDYIYTTKKQREEDPGIPASRVDYVPLAFTMLRYFLQLNHSPGKIAYSPYALKEGVLSEMFLA